METPAQDQEINTAASSSSKRKQVILYTGLVIIFLLIAGVFLVALRSNHTNTNQQKITADLTRVTPYYGYMNLYPDYKQADIASAAMVLGYYGDDRYSLNDLKGVLTGTSTGYRGTALFEYFFKQIGYDTHRGIFSTENQGEKINTIKSYIQKGVPVIVVLQKTYNDVPGNDITTAVVTGVFDDKKTVTVHDLVLGNNYRYSFDEFNNTLLPNSGFLAVWPSQKLVDSGSIKGTSTTAVTPEKDVISSEMAEFFEKTLEAGVLAKRANNLCAQHATGSDISESYSSLFEQSIKLRKEIIASPVFVKLPKLVQLKEKMFLAFSLRKTGRLSEAIDYTTKEVVPYDGDLTVLAGGESGWQYKFDPSDPIQVIDGKTAFPWHVIGASNFYLGNLNKAKSAFEQALKIDPYDARAQEYMDKLSQPGVEPKNDTEAFECMGGYEVVK